MSKRWAVAVLMLGVVLLAGEASARGVGSAGTVASRGVTAGDAVISLSASISGHHTCVLSGDGSVRCWGHNDTGQLGDGTTTDRLTPVAVSGLTGAVALAAGGSHTCALRANGTMRCWGNNGFGQLGDGTTTNRLTPVAVGGLTDAVALAPSGFHTCALRVDGSVRSPGGQQPRSAGRWDLTEQFHPDSRHGGEREHQCTAPGGWRHPHLRAARRRQRAPPGKNSTGQLGDGTTTNRLTAVEVPSFHFNIDPAVALHPPGRVATVTALVACPEDQQVRLWISLNQGEAGGEGRAVEACTGQLERYPVEVHAHGRAFFEPGPAEAEAEGVVREHGAMVDIQEWRLEVELELLPPRHR